MRALTGFRIAYGSALLLAPRITLSALPHDRVDAAACTFARLLGARQLLEALITARAGSPAWTRAGAAVDATHCASMLALAAARPSRRAPAVANAVVAGGLAATGYLSAAGHG